MTEIIEWMTRMTRQGFPCLFHLLTGLYCPGCGGTRAVRAMAAGNLRLSFQYHPLVLYTAAAKNPRWYLGHETLFVYIAAGIIVVNWICKNVLLVFFGIDLLPAWG